MINQKLVYRLCGKLQTVRITYQQIVIALFTLFAVAIPVGKTEGAQLLGLYTFEEATVADVQDISPAGNHPIDLSDAGCRSPAYNQPCYPTNGGSIVPNGFEGKALSVTGDGGPSGVISPPDQGSRQQWANQGQTLYVPIDINDPAPGPNVKPYTVGGWFKSRNLGTGGGEGPNHRAGLWGTDEGGWDTGLMRDGIRYYVTGTDYVNTATGPGGNGNIVAPLDEWQFVAVSYPSPSSWKLWADVSGTLQIANGNKQPLDNNYSSAPWISIGGYTTHDASNNEPWDGEIDNFFVFDRMLTDGQIDTIRSGGVSGIETVCNCALTTSPQSLRANFTEGQQTGEPISVPIDAGGSATVMFDPNNNELSWTIDWSNLSGVANGLRFHGPAAVGTDASVEVNAGAISGLTSPSIGSTTITNSQKDDLLAGLWYLNIHTPTNGPGEIRGQVRFDSPVNYASTSTGFWDDSSNWSPVLKPSTNEQVKINPADGLTIIGPAAHDAKVRIMDIGATSSGVAELRLQANTTLTVDEVLTIQNRGRITGSGTVDAVLNIEAGGELVALTGDAITVQRKAKPNEGTITTHGSITFDKVLTNNTEINAINGTLRFNGGLNNNGDLNLINTTISGTVNLLDGTMTGTTSVNGNLNNVNGTIFIGFAQSGGTAVPEPTGLVLIVLGMTGLLYRGRVH